jgi:ABC-type sulfate transport system permease subunit
MPLHVEILYNEYQFAAAFAVASLLARLALVTLVLKYVGGAHVARPGEAMIAKIRAPEAGVLIEPP